MDISRETPDFTTKPKCYDLTNILVYTTMLYYAILYYTILYYTILVPPNLQGFPAVPRSSAELAEGWATAVHVRTYMYVYIYIYMYIHTHIYIYTYSYIIYIYTYIYLRTFSGGSNLSAPCIALMLSGRRPSPA